MGWPSVIPTVFSVRDVTETASDEPVLEQAVAKAIVAIRRDGLIIFRGNLVMREAQR
jgi:hypothetical protein